MEDRLRRVGDGLGIADRREGSPDLGALIAAAVTRQVDQLDAEIRERVALRDRLAAISDGLANEDAPSVGCSQPCRPRRTAVRPRRTRSRSASSLACAS